MQEYKEMYLTITRAVEKAMKQLMTREVENALNLLTRAKQECEELYICEEEEAAP